MLSPTSGTAWRRPAPIAATPAPTRLLSLLDARFVTEDMSRFATVILDRAAAHRPGIAVGVNAHLVNQMAGDDLFAEDLKSVDLLYADGQSVVWAARLLHVRVIERIATTDLAPLVVEGAAARGLKVFLLGGAPGVADEAAEQLLKAHPTASIRTHHGYFESEDEELRVVREIRTWGTDILFVGMGDPRQLRWATQHRAALGPAVVLTSGGLFDWLSGRNVRAPHWMITAGLEWLWRLVIEPKRLWRRYVLGNPAFVARVARSFVLRAAAAVATAAAARRTRAGSRPV